MPRDTNPERINRVVSRESYTRSAGTLGYLPSDKRNLTGSTRPAGPRPDIPNSPMIVSHYFPVNFLKGGKSFGIHTVYCGGHSWRHPDLRKVPREGTPSSRILFELRITTILSETPSVKKEVNELVACL